MKNKTSEYLTMSKYLILLFIGVDSSDEKRKNEWKMMSKTEQSWDSTFPHAEIFSCTHAKHKTNVSCLIIAFLLKVLQVHPTSCLFPSFHPLPSMNFSWEYCTSGLWLAFVELCFSVLASCSSCTKDLCVRRYFHS